MEVKLRLKGGKGIRSPGKTRTTVWKPPLTDPWKENAKIHTSHTYIHYSLTSFTANASQSTPISEAWEPPQF